MQSFEHRTTLPAPTADVIAAITTREYLLFRYEDPELHHLHIEISQNDEEGFACTVSRSGSTDKLPGFVRKVAGEHLTLIQDQSWNGRQAPVDGHLHIHLEGLPGHVHVDLKLDDVGNGQSEMQAHGQVVAKIPLLGGRIEKMLVGRAEEAFAKSAEAISEYLQSDRG